MRDVFAEHAGTMRLVWGRNMSKRGIVYRRINGLPRNVAGGRLSEDEAKEIGRRITSKRVMGGLNGKERRAEYVRKNMGDILQSQGRTDVRDHEYADPG